MVLGKMKEMVRPATGCAILVASFHNDPRVKKSIQETDRTGKRWEAPARKTSWREEKREFFFRGSSPEGTSRGRSPLDE
ncbi:hypothetical protein A2232_03550 [candidate division WOR-1 bacterium RIFOXYA2_FULL_46_56]|uniref:Uncharacterized protein n=1 Tax=candidate division WOR-1 bacterium RIFOXYC2_FULL_46_14 TaxID=1802587 RepID=A0A1F4U4E4_UNCSA|nr:MAG: hypothetical protein A2292_08485 [candidate division WOR-1 bacterium RIFOXYB2_FULL_46_45]OGC29081.1 MAG: hypothetical protein A2232_03550 [candidate division WOR-1 bacterium RIFOXYA2_FULL_46_56]OGC39700.1 MAG: hypothetical protein A2438_06940 [candidate division WOR-1 bacterium RIFOXYC2_FULL_46_14]